jgi:hypothetical protein
LPIKVYINYNFIPEVSYVIETLLGNFLNIDFEIIPNEKQNYYFELPNGSILRVENHFFLDFKNPNEYLKPEFLPQNIDFYKSKYNSVAKLPIIYGNWKFQENSTEIVCGLDIIASSFFMLTRWEEFVIKTRDKHNRFSAKDSLAFKFGFLQYPVVNEYADLLKSIFEDLGYEIPAQTRKFTPIITHDVDFIFKWKNSLSFLKTLTADLFKRKSLTDFSKTLSFKFSNNDPFDNFDYFMDLSEKYSLKSTFFLLIDGKHKLDFNYKNRVIDLKKLISKIQNRKHNLGIHLSYDSYNNIEIISTEISEFKELTNVNSITNRQHFLRLEVPQTWQIWEDCGIVNDYSMYYSDAVGFRMGTCYDINLFNFQTCKTLNVVEFPLIFMDTTMINDENFDFSMLENMLEQTKKHNGNFVVLWHNSNLYNKNLKNTFEKLLNLLF